jgi:hypothetical protein
MDKKIFLSSIFFIILFINFVSATEQIQNSTFIIKIHNNTLEIISSEYSGNNGNFTFEIENITNSTNNSSYLSVKSAEFIYNFLFVKNITVEMDLVDKYTNCLNDTSICKLNAASNFTQCTLTYQQKDNDIINKQLQIDNLTKEKNDTQNQKYFWGIIGVVLGIIGVLVKRGEIGKDFKDRHENSFQRNQSN